MPNLADEISLKVQDHETKTSTDGSDRSSPIYDGASSENAVLKKQTTTRSVSPVKRLNKKSTANKNKIGVALILSQKDNKTPQPTVKHIPEIGCDFVLRTLENKKVKLTITKYSTLGGEYKIPDVLAKCVDFIKKPKQSIESIHDFISQCCCGNCLKYLNKVVSLSRIDDIICKCEPCTAFYLYNRLNDYEYICEI